MLTRSMSAGAVALAMGAAFLTCQQKETQAQPEPAVVALAPPAQTAPEKTLGAMPSLAPLVKQVRPAVVNIYTTETVRERRGRRFGEEDDPFEMWRRFFPPERQMQRNALGSGFIIDAAGLVLTNNHVVERADEIRVRLNDGREFGAKVKGRDPATDVALLQLGGDGPMKDLPVVKLGDSDRLEVGDYVIAIGNPFGLAGTVSAGIVSAKERSGADTGAGTQFQQFIQTDAAINPGNSGGPLLNLAGEAVGMNTAIVAGGGPFGRAGNIGIGFAVPINTIRDLLPQLREKGKVSRGYLGVLIQDLTPELAEEFKVSGKGALVSQVYPGSPADKAGLKAGDVVVEYNGKRIESYNQLSRMAAATPPGEKARIKVMRDGKEKSVELKVAERSDESVAGVEPGGGENEHGALGLSVRDLTPDVARELGLRDAEGVLVENVEPGSAAARAGLQQGDVVVELDRKQVASVDDFRKVLTDVKAGSTTSMRVRRAGGAIFLALKVPKK